MYILESKISMEEILKSIKRFKNSTGYDVDIIIMSRELWQELLSPHKISGVEVYLTDYLPWRENHIVMANKEFFYGSTYRPYSPRTVIQTAS